MMEPGKIRVMLAGEAGEHVAIMLELGGKHAQARLEPEHAETVAADLRHHAAMARRRRLDRAAGEVPPDERFNIGPGSLDVRVEVDPNDKVQVAAPPKCPHRTLIFGRCARCNAEVDPNG